MTPLWSAVVAVFAIANILACVWLLIWTGKKRPNEVAEGAETGHVWDDDLTEYNNPLPRWWLNLFLITVIFGMLYLLLYPGLGNFAGLLGWTKFNQHDQRLAVVLERRAELYAAFDTLSVAQLADDPAAHTQGEKLFTANCAGCHGTDARGAIGFPNLTDDAWLYGGTPEAILTTLEHGRNGQMPAFVGSMSDADVRGLVALLQDWNRAHERPERHADAIAKFGATCAACHGQDGRGNVALGAPDLTDDDWLYGGSEQAIRHTILYGRQGAMPAFAELLSDTERRLITAWLLNAGDGGRQLARSE